MSEKSEADIAALALELSQELHDGEEAACKLAHIQEIIDVYLAKEWTPTIGWDALLEIRKVLK